MELKAERAIEWSDDAAPQGIQLERVYVGPDPHGLGGFQVAVGSCSEPPSRDTLRTLFTARRGKTTVQLIVALTFGGVAYLFGPDAQGLPIELPIDLAQRQLQSVLSERDVLAATERLAGLRKAHDTSAVGGFTNNGLFATHHLRNNVPARADWAQLGERAQPILRMRNVTLIEGLGYSIQQGPNGILTLSADGRPPRAIAVLLDESEQFESKSERFQLSPVAFGLAVAARQELPWLVVLRKDQIRLYPGRDGVGVGSKGQAETFFEIDLATVDAEYAALLPLVFSAEALAPDGSTDELLRDSARYATELGARLRERIYGEVMEPIATEVAYQLAAGGLRLDSDGLATAYQVSLRILFRLLFQAYAEDRGLLPSGRNEGFDANSLNLDPPRSGVGSVRA